MYSVTLGLLTILLILCRKPLCSRIRFYWFHFQLSGPWGFPIIGIAHKLLKIENVLQNLETYLKYYKSPFVTWLGPKCFLYCGDPVTLETVLSSTAWIQKGFIYPLISEVIGDGLITSNSPRWNRHRRLLNPAYNRSAVNSFSSIFNQEANKFVSNLAGAQNQSLDLFELLKRSILETSFRTAMDKKMNFQNNDFTAFMVDSYNKLVNLGSDRIIRPWLYPDIIFRFSSLHKSTQQMNLFFFNIMENFLKPNAESSFFVGQTLKHKSSINKNINSFISDKLGNDISNTYKSHAFVEHARNLMDKNLMTLEDAVAEANLIVVAAFETSATSLYFVCLCLAMHPQCQDKLYHELMELFPSFSNEGNTTTMTLSEVTQEHLAQMTYTEMVINETMRLFAPVPLIMRDSSADITLKNGVTVPKGIQCFIDIFNLHRNEEIWGPYAHSFAPEIHFGPSSPKPHPFAFMPFAKGLRMCAGYHYAVVLLKVMIAKMFRNFYFTTDAKISELKVKPAISLKLCHYPLLKVMKR